MHCLINESGKPPRSRGKLVSKGLLPDPYGKTPALTGQTVLPVRRGLVYRENPRAHGANSHNQLITIIHYT